MNRAENRGNPGWFDDLQPIRHLHTGPWLPLKQKGPGIGPALQEALGGSYFFSGKVRSAFASPEAATVI